MIGVPQARFRRSGMSMPEIMIASTIAVGMMAVLFTAFIQIQRGFTGSEELAEAVANQTRLLDYLSLDLRRATTASSSGTSVDLTIPDYYNKNSSTKERDWTRNPITYTSTSAYYGNLSGIRIQYRKDGDRILRREETASGTGDFQELVVAEGVQDFDLRLVVYDSSGAEVTSITNAQTAVVSYEFAPRFRFARSQSSATASDKLPMRVTASILLRNRWRN